MKELNNFFPEVLKDILETVGEIDKTKEVSLEVAILDDEMAEKVREMNRAKKDKRFEMKQKLKELEYQFQQEVEAIVEQMSEEIDEIHHSLWNQIYVRYGLKTDKKYQISLSDRKVYQLVKAPKQEIKQDPNSIFH